MSNKIFNIVLIVVATVVFTVTWIAAYPLFQYALDADAVGYLTVARRVAQFDYLKSINGLWSPLNSWLLVPFIRKGFDAFTVALYMNAVFGLMCLWLTFTLLVRFVQHRLYLLATAIFLPITLVYYCYFQVFGDIMMIAFLLAYLCLATTKKYQSSIALHLLGASLCAIAYYAKTYAFPFYIFHISLLIALTWITKQKINWLPKIAGFAFLLLLVIPWGLVQKAKYQKFSLTGNAGKLNMSWYINSRKTFKEDITYLIPPTYHDSPSFWEDPMPSQGQLTSPFDNSKSFVKWLARIAHTCIVAVLCYNEISAFALVLLLLGAYLFYRKMNYELLVLATAAIAITIGYLSVHIETRYIWLAGLVAVIFGGALLAEVNNKNVAKILALIIPMSFVIFPIYSTEIMAGKGKDNFELAAKLKELQIRNSKFTSNEPDAGKMWVVAYLSKNKFYTIEDFSYNTDQLEGEFNKYHIDYYIEVAGNKNFTTELGEKKLYYEKVYGNDALGIYRVGR